MRKKLAEKYAKKLNKLVEEFNISYNANQGGSGMMAVQIFWFMKSLGFNVNIKKYDNKYSIVIDEFEVNPGEGEYSYVNLYDEDEQSVYWSKDTDNDIYDHKNDLDFIKALNKLKL